MISILCPCRNEAKNIKSFINNVFSFIQPNENYEVIIVDGMSDDGTRDILFNLQKKYTNLKVLDNPQRTVPHAMNIGIKHAQGEYIVRCDVRCIHPKSYLTDLLKLKEETGAENVGGVLVPIGKTYIQKCIALAYKSPIAMGGALRDRGDYRGDNDTVYGGCFKKDYLIKIGMYDEEMVRNQDDELSFRIRKNGGRIIQDGRIKIKYYPRDKFSKLFKQFLQYGYWKVAVLKKHPKQASIRHIIPSLFILILFFLFVGAFFSKTLLYILSIYLGGYILAIAFETLRLSIKDRNIKLWPGAFLAILIIHNSFGIGFIIGLISKLLHLKPKYFETLSR